MTHVTAVHDRYGHIGLSVPDVYAASKRFEVCTCLHDIQ